MTLAAVSVVSALSVFSSRSCSTDVRSFSLPVYRHTSAEIRGHDARQLVLGSKNYDTTRNKYCITWKPNLNNTNRQRGKMTTAVSVSCVTSSSSRMRVINHNWSATKQRRHPQSVAEISHHSVLSGDRIRQCETSSGSRHKDTCDLTTMIVAVT